MLKVDSYDRCFPSIMKKEHYSVCSEPGGRYLCHFTPQKDLNKKKPVEVVADNLVNFMNMMGIDKTLQAIGGDYTNANTGGIIHLVEAQLNCELIWLVCALHANKLPLQHLIEMLNGNTLSNNWCDW